MVKHCLVFLFEWGDYMQDIVKTIEVRLPLTSAEKVCLNETLSVYPKAYNYVSKYICKKRKLSQTELLKDLFPQLNDKYKLNRISAKSIIRTVVSCYKENNKRRKWKRIRFKRKYHVLYWGLDYKLTERQFYINTSSGKIKFKVEDYDSYFCITPYVFFEPAVLKKRLSGYYLIIPIVMKIEEEMTKTEKRLVDIGIKILWRTISKKMIVR